jgi:hypothetical protein
MCFADHAAAFEASGIWIGKRTCTGFGTDHGKITTKNLGSTLSIFQSDRYAAIELDGFLSFSAIAIEDTAKPKNGHLGVVQCGSSDTFIPFGVHELGRLTIATKPNGKGSIRGTSIEAASFFGDSVLTCKWSYKRFQVSFPNVPICDGQEFPAPTPTRTPGPSGSPCPAAVEMISNAGSQRVLDVGWTGISHNQTFIQDGKLTFTVSGCDNAVRPCGVCDVGGPIQNLKADQGDINAHRCSNDTSIKCTDNSACGSGTCVFYFGAPLPLAAGGVSTCVTNQINGAVSGTANIETGTFESNLTLTSRVYSAIETAIPCPVCNGDATVNDGQKGGMCSGGTKNGQPCDGNGRSPVESFGTTSLDCPPNPGALIATLPIVFNGSSGTETIELTAGSPGCSAAPGKKCFCPAEQQTTKPNGCVDTTDSAADGSLCQPKGGSQTEGTCPESVALHCQIQDFLGCLADSDCPAPGDSCTTEPTPCFLDNGAVGGKVLAIGMADPPTNGEADPTLAALFCVGRTSSSGVNSAAGLPGLGRIELPIHSKEILTLP